MWGDIWELLLLAIPELPGELSYSSQFFFFVIFSTIKAVSRSLPGVCHNWKHVQEKETHAASRASTCLEKDKVGASFCHCCHGLCWPEIMHLWLMEVVRKTILFYGLIFTNRFMPLVPLGMCYPFELCVSTYCFVTYNIHKHEIKPESLWFYFLPLFLLQWKKKFNLHPLLLQSC